MSAIDVFSKPRTAKTSSAAFLANGRSGLNRLIFRLLAGRGIARKGAKAMANLKNILETADA